MDSIPVRALSARPMSFLFRSLTAPLGLGLAALCSTDVGRAQSFSVQATGGNTFGGPPVACQFLVQAAQPVTQTQSCSDANGTWIGTAVADRGALHASAYVEWHQPGLFTLGTENNFVSRFLNATFVVQGPFAGSIPISFRVDVECSGVVSPGDGLAGATATVNVFGFFFTVPLNSTQSFVVSTNVGPNLTQQFTLVATAATFVRGPFLTNMPSASVNLSVRFPIGEPVFVLPPGYTVNAPELGIVNNLWVGPEQCTFPPSRYGAGKTNSLGCLPAIDFTGTAALGNPAPFVVSASNVINNKVGLMIYAYAPASIPFLGGTLFLAPPIRRTSPQFSGGAPPPDDCSGSFGFDLNAYIDSGGDPWLVAGASVYCQYWYRDPLDPQAAGLTDALCLKICP